jgi:hypothetical protein
MKLTVDFFQKKGRVFVLDLFVNHFIGEISCSKALYQRPPRL